MGDSGLGYQQIAEGSWRIGALESGSKDWMGDALAGG